MPRHHTRHKIFDHHIGMARQIERHFAPLRMGEVQRHAFFTSIETDKVSALIGAAGFELVVETARIVALDRALDLDDACAEIGHQACAIGARKHAGEIEYGEAVEECG